MAEALELAAIGRAMAGLPNPVIVELGAHTGEDEAVLRAACTAPDEDIHYILVEPDPRNVNAILNRPRIINGRAHHPRAVNHRRRLIIGAVSDVDGEALFHLSENPKDRNHASGSLLEPTGHKTGMPWITFEKQTWVQTFRLDTVFNREYLTRIDLLWTDIQGAERQMIAGGREALQHTRYVFMEKESVELYAGQALRDELVARMAECGFLVTEEFRYNVLFRNHTFRERGPR